MNSAHAIPASVRDKNENFKNLVQALFYADDVTAVD